MNEIAGGTRTKWRGKRLAFALIGLAVFGLFLGWSLFYRPSAPPFDPYETYYRLVVDLSDKKGRPVGIDIVVGCGVHHGQSIGGGSIFEVMAMDSAFYAWAIPDGHALSVRTSPAIAAADTCAGATTDNGRIARDWLPFIIWYDDASDLSHGLGYATQDAYSNPRANIKFMGAYITRASSAEYAEFKKKGPVNLLPKYLADVRINYNGPNIISGGAKISREMIKDPKLSWKISDWITCRGVIRTPLPDNLKAQIARLRPTSASKYWSYSENIPLELLAKIPLRDETYDGGHMRPSSSTWDAMKPKVYSQSFDGNLDTLSTETFVDGSFKAETKIIPENLGFMDCGRPAPYQLASLVTGRLITQSAPYWVTCYVDGIQVFIKGRCTPTIIAFENLDFVLRQARQLLD